MKLNGLAFSFVTLFIIVFITLLLYVVWQNRLETKVITALVPALSAGIIIPLVTVFTVLSPETRETKIPSTFFYYFNLKRSVPLVKYYQSNTRLPIDGSANLSPPAEYPGIYNEAEQHILISDFGRIPTQEAPVENGHGSLNSADQRRYFRMFLTGFAWSLCRTFGRSWDIETTETNFPAVTNTETVFHEDSDATFVDWKHIQANLNDLDIFNNNNIDLDSIPGYYQGFHVPPNSVLNLDQEGDHAVEITIDNKFATIRINIRRIGSSRGFGRVGTLLGLPPNQIVTNISYISTVTTRLKRWRIGHPHMPKYRRWTQNIENELGRLDIEVMQQELKVWRALR